MIIYTWNVNGIRAACVKTFMNFVKNENWDIICLQEIRCNESQFPQDLYNFCISNNVRVYWNSSVVKQGYAGTAILSKIPLNNATNYFDDKIMMGEGRIITAELKDFNLITAYIPNSKREFERLDIRCQIEDKILSYLKSKAPCIYCGDLNAVVEDKDIYNPTLKAPGNSSQEREKINNILKSGFIDAFRYKHKEIKYSWFSNFGNARENNTGWRLDYFIVSEQLKERIVDCDIINYKGSDHLPVKLELR